MKKIMFDNHYGLEDAVLNGTKTMTRRIIKGRFEDVKAYHANGGWHFIADTEDGDSIELKPHYETCEIVAIAQSYHTLNKSGFVAPEWLEHTCESSAGYKNKMFVRADLMPHQIQITDVRVERLQDITDEDCMKEGIYIITDVRVERLQDITDEDCMKEGIYIDATTHFDVKPFKDGKAYCFNVTRKHTSIWYFSTPKLAFEGLIRKMYGKKVWDNNPYVFAYSFKLIK